MYEYLIGGFILFIAWLLFFILRRDLRKPMVWTGVYYLVFSSITVLIWGLLHQFTYVGEKIIPSYWNPPELFGLGMITGFGGIEDLLFVFLTAGLAACIYEFLFRKRIKVKQTRKPHIRALIISLTSFFVFAHILPYNLIYSLMLSYFIGFLALIIERKDLAKHALFGGVSFLIMYAFLFLIFNLIFPTYIQQYYTLQNFIGIFILHIPIEEYLFAFAFGLMWAPLYEYEHGEKDGSFKSK